MASEGGVLGVIRSARPVFRSPHDRVAFAVHAAFLAAGYSLTAVGSRADAPQEEQEEVEVGIEGWNDMGDAYAFRYAGIDEESCKIIMVKCVAMGDMLMVDAAPLAETSDAKSGEPLHLEIKVTDYVSSRDGSNYGLLYKNLHELVDRLNSSIFSKLSPPPPKESSSASTSRLVFPSIPSLGSGDIMPTPGAGVFPSSLVFPPIPSLGSGDRMPGPGAGVFPSRIDTGFESGMLIGPNDPSWGIGVGPYQRPSLPDSSLLGVPPGARFDPYGPPGVHGFEPNRFNRDQRRPPGGGAHPDLEHFSPL